MQGGSTLTQQLVRNLYIGNQQKTFSRKIKEACLADKLFSRMQTQYGAQARGQILAAYLNQVFYGHHAYGVEAAAQTYFSKSAADLNLSQAALHRRTAAGADVVRPARPSRGTRSSAVTTCCGRCGRTATSRAASTRRRAAKPLGLKPGHLYTRLRQPNFFGWATQQLAADLGSVRAGSSAAG